MALGKPAISDPARLDLRPIAESIRNARQRIEAIEAAVAVIQNTTLSATTLAALQAQVNAIVRSNGTVTSVGATVPSFMSVAGSPITLSGTLALTFNNQSRGEVFAGPVAGSDAPPDFRALQWDYDLPLISTLPFISGVDSNDILLVERYGTMYWTTVGSVVSGGGGGGGGSGTVTSVAATVPSFLSLSGSPITTSGTLAISLANQSANAVFAGPASGGAAAPTFRALTAADMPVAATTYTRGASWSGAGAAITTSTDVVFVECPIAGTITKVTVLTAGGTGSCVIDIWKDTYSVFPPTVADTITASAKPTISSNIKYQDSTLTGWTTSVAAGDILAFHIDSVSVFTYLSITLTIQP